jgi:hypothetical protein
MEFLLQNPVLHLIQQMKRVAPRSSYTLCRRKHLQRFASALKDEQIGGATTHQISTGSAEDEALLQDEDFGSNTGDRYAGDKPKRGSSSSLSREYSSSSSSSSSANSSNTGRNPSGNTGPNPNGDPGPLLDLGDSTLTANGNTNGNGKTNAGKTNAGPNSNTNATYQLSQITKTAPELASGAILAEQGSQQQRLLFVRKGHVWLRSGH